MPLRFSRTDSDPNFFNMEKDGHIEIWRYMSIRSFLRFLEQEALYFCRMTHLGGNDPNDGSVRGKGEEWRLNYYRRELLKMELQPIYMDASPQTKSHWRKKLELAVDRLFDKEYMWINCWHIAENENMAMWQTYGNGVAIVSTYRQLYTTLKEAVEKVEGFAVNYDALSDNTSAELIHPCMYKADAYRFENEFRLYLPAGEHEHLLGAFGDREANGYLVSICFDELIKEIVVGPYMGEPVYDALKKMARLYGVENKMKKSTLDYI